MSRAFLCLLLAATAARAQAQAIAASSQTDSSAIAIVRLTLDEAVSRSIAASPRLARLAALDAAAEAQTRGARAERWPLIDLSAGYTRRSDVPELTIAAPASDPRLPPQRITVFPNIPDNTRLRAGVALPLYTGGRIGAQVEAADQGQKAAQQDLRAARGDLVLETKTAYWSLLTAREGVRVLEEAMRAFDAHLADARNRERFGLAARNEVLAVQVERDRVELDRLRAEASADLAEANLRRLLDLPPTAHVDTAEPLAAAGPPVSPDLETLVAQAAGSRPERRAAAARATAAEAIARVEHGSRLPQIALGGGYTYANPNRDIVPPTSEWKDTWDVGVGLSWNLLDFGRRSANEARARAQADAARQLVRELDRGIRLEVTQRVLELRTAEARLAVAERSVLSAVENRRVTGDRYREGVVPSSERLDAELAHERAALARTEALASLRLAAAGLDRAVGR